MSRGTSCSAAVRRARDHMRRGQSDYESWPVATSLFIAPPRLSRGSFVKPPDPEPLHLGFASQTASAVAGPWR